MGDSRKTRCNTSASCKPLPSSVGEGSSCGLILVVRSCPPSSSAPLAGSAPYAVSCEGAILQAGLGLTGTRTRVEVRGWNNWAPWTRSIVSTPVDAVPLFFTPNQLPCCQLDNQGNNYPQFHDLSFWMAALLVTSKVRCKIWSVARLA